MLFFSRVFVGLNLYIYFFRFVDFLVIKFFSCSKFFSFVYWFFVILVIGWNYFVLIKLKFLNLYYFIKLLNSLYMMM